MKKIITITVAILVMISLTAFKFLHSGGEAGATGSPGEGLCSGCHSGGAGATTVSVTSSPAFINNTYGPGQIYTVSIAVSNSEFSNFGFACEILNSSNANAGLMANAGTGVKFLNSGARKNATHTTPKSGTGSAVFTFEWTAPVSGDVTFYAAGNAVNLNGNTLGDLPGSAQLALTSDVTTGLSGNEKMDISGLSVFPNPASDLTTISYYLPGEKNIRIELIEINGRIIRTIVDEKQAAGPHSNIADLKGISKGIYFIKVYAGVERVSQKLISVQ